MFDDNIFAATPSYIDSSFYSTLRDVFINEIIDNSLKLERHPIYKTGKVFYSNLKKFLSAVYINEYEFLSNIKEDEIRNYVNINLDKAYEVIGVYEKELELEPKLFINEKKKLKYFNEDYLVQLETNFLTNKKLENNDTLIIDNITCENDIQGEYILEEYGIKFNINKAKANTFSITINNLNDFGLILKIPEKINDQTKELIKAKEKEKNEMNVKKLNEKDLIEKTISYDEIRLEFYKLWENICKKINFTERNIINSFNLFISSIIKRRNDNVNKWLEEITENYNNLKYLQTQISPLDNKWIICQEKCTYCYYKCTLLQGHNNKDFKAHECPYDHKCKGDCSICKDCKCIEEKCK